MMQNVILIVLIVLAMISQWIGFALGRQHGKAIATVRERARCHTIAMRYAWTNKNSSALGPEQNCVKIAGAIIDESETN